MIAKAKAEPGKLAFGSPGHGTINQLAVEWLALEAGIKLLHVPYRGGAALVNGLAAGDTALGVTTLTSVKGLVDDGKIKVVAQLNRERPAFLQAWPTMTDAGLKRCRTDARPLRAGPHAGGHRVAPRFQMLRVVQDGALRKRFNELGRKPPRSAGTPWPSASAAKPRGSSRSSSSPA